MLLAESACVHFSPSVCYDLIERCADYVRLFCALHFYAHLIVDFGIVLGEFYYLNREAPILQQQGDIIASLTVTRRS